MRFERRVHVVGQQQRIGDAGDLLGLAPRTLELGQLALDGAALGLLVQRHLQREAVLLRSPNSPLPR